MPITQQRMLAILADYESCAKALRALREAIEMSLEASPQGQGPAQSPEDRLGELIGELGMALRLWPEPRAEAVVLERAHFKRWAQVNEKQKLKQRTVRGVAAKIADRERGQEGLARAVARAIGHPPIPKEPQLKATGTRAGVEWEPEQMDEDLAGLDPFTGKPLGAPADEFAPPTQEELEEYQRQMAEVAKG